MAQLASAGDAAMLPPPPSASLAWARAGSEYEGEGPTSPHPSQRLGMGPIPKGWGGASGAGMPAHMAQSPAPILFPPLGGGAGADFLQNTSQDRSDEAYGRFAALMADTIDGRMSLTECLEASQKCCRDLCAGLRCVLFQKRWEGKLALCLSGAQVLRGS